MKTLSSIALNPALVDNTRLIIGASNDRAISGQEWEKITPWGKFQNDKGLQDVSPEAGRALVAAFNEQKEKEGAAFLGVPIFVGHPDVDPKAYPDHRRYGKLTALAVRLDGLYGKPAWNDLGAQNQEQGYFVFPSPVWYFKNVGRGIIVPEELASIGLTNTPNIPGSSPWAKNDEGDASAEPSDEEKRKICAEAADRISAITGRPISTERVLADIRATRSQLETFTGAAQRLVASAIPARSSSSGSGTHVHIHIGASNTRAANDSDLSISDPATAKKPTALAARVRENLIKRRAPLLSAIDAAKERQAGYAGASQIAIEAKRLMEAGESHEIAYAKARAAFPAAATAHDAAVREHRKKLEENDRDNQIALAAHALMAKDNSLSYIEATRRAKEQISNKT